jgi:predicted Zn-dependent protease with MMP-like domain
MKYRERIQNVAVLVEDEPSEEVRKLEGLEEEDTLLGLYLGVPQTVRGEGYGVGVTLPDTITIYRLPALLEAEEVLAREKTGDLNNAVRKVVQDTIWHEVGHYFGYDDLHIESREEEGTNKYKAS